MGIPTILKIKKERYSLIKIYKDKRDRIKFCLYENTKTKTKECFSLYQIKIIKNMEKTTKVVETR
jgi:hypothetical protein